MNTISRTKTADLNDFLRVAKGGYSENHEPNLPEIGDWAREKRLNPHLSDAQIRSQIEKIKRKAEHNLLLYRNQYGKLAISNHLIFPRTFNVSANVPTERGRIEVIRPYWLGKGSTYIFNKFDPSKIRSVDEIEKFISSVLIDQIVEMVLLYHGDADMTPRELVIKERNTGQKIRRSMYRDQFDFNFGASTFTHKLVVNLAEWVENKCPEDWKFIQVPEMAEFEQWSGVILTSHEYALIKAKLKCGEYSIPEQIKASKEKAESELIKQTNKELLKEVAYLRSQLEKGSSQQNLSSKSEEVDDEMEELKERYKEEFGQAPPHNVKLKTLRTKLGVK